MRRSWTVVELFLVALVVAAFLWDACVREHDEAMNDPARPMGVR